jgi:DNA-binding beta-propeller fold protein YncE
MHNLVVLPDETILLADTFNHRIRKYDPKTKTVSAVAGTGKRGYLGDGGEATDAQFDQTICIAAHGDRIWVADIGNRRVRLINTTEDYIRPFAGTGARGVPKDGEAAKNQPLVDPRAVAVRDEGSAYTIYILERSGHALRVVDRDGKIRTVAGTGKPGKGGDGGPALKAAMNGPKYVSIDRDGSVLIADTENHQIRRYVPGKETMELVAGSGKKGSGGVGSDPLKLEMSRPHGVIAHPKTGEIYIADSDNGRILKIVKE